MTEASETPETNNPPFRRRRPRYAGKYPRRFEEKYKEHQPEKYAETVAKVVASGKTPAGTHRPIMVREALAALEPGPGDRVVDCTLGYGGHARAFLERITPGGRLLGLDADPLELPKTEARLRALGFGPEAFTVRRANFAGVAGVVAEAGLGQATVIFADLGVSSMQLDQPARGFSLKADGPLDMRMNPGKGLSADRLVAQASPEQLAELLRDNADEPRAEMIARKLAGAQWGTTGSLNRAVRSLLQRSPAEEIEATTRRVFQALRIAVNDEFGALEALLKQIPGCLAPGGRAAFLTFHSGEDRRVKQSFERGRAAGLYSAISQEVIRPTPDEQRENPRSSPAKLRWAIAGPPSPG